MMYQFSPVSLRSLQFLSFFRFRRPFWGLSGEIEFSLTPCGFAGKIPLKYEALQALQGFQYRVLISSNFHQSPFGREHSKTVGPHGHVGSNPTRCAIKGSRLWLKVYYLFLCKKVIEARVLLWYYKTIVFGMHNEDNKVGKRCINGINDLLTTHPQLSKEWHM